MNIDSTRAALILSKKKMCNSHFRSFLRTSCIFTALSYLSEEEKEDDIFTSQNFSMIDYIFVSSEFSENEVAKIKSLCRKKNSDSLSSLIIIYSEEQELSRKRLIRYLVACAHGVLLSPFCVHDLLNCCGLSGQATILSSKDRLKIAVKMIIQDGIEESQTPSLVHIIPEETKNEFKKLTNQSVSDELVQYLTSMNHAKRLGTYDSLCGKVKDFIRQSIRANFAS